MRKEPVQDAIKSLGQHMVLTSIALINVKKNAEKNLWNMRGQENERT